MIGRLGLVLLVLGGCVPKVPAAVTFPDAASADVADPTTVLSEAAVSEDPWTRTRALALLIRASAEPGGGPWGLVGLSESDPAGLREVVLALAARADPLSVSRLEALVARPDVDPYVRAAAAFRLPAPDAAAAAWRAADDPWVALPLAFAALARGDAPALEVVALGLSQGDVALEPAFLADVGASDLTALRPALADGAARCEEEIATAWAAARVGLGDPGAAAVLRDALRGDPLEALDVMDSLASMDGPLARSLLEGARRHGGVVRDFATVTLAARGVGSPEALPRAVGSDDVEVRRLALDRIAHAGDLPRRVEAAARRAVAMGLAHDDPTTRSLAARASIVVGIGGWRDVLARLTSDDAPAVRIEAAGALLVSDSPRR